MLQDVNRPMTTPTVEGAGRRRGRLVGLALFVVAAAALASLLLR